VIAVELAGLDGANPLGFLAAVGLLRVVSRIAAESRPRLAWRAEGRWLPVMFLDDPTMQGDCRSPAEELCERVAQSLRLDVDDEVQAELVAARKELARARKTIKDRRTELEMDARRANVPRSERRGWIDAQLEPERSQLDAAAAVEDELRSRAYTQPHLAVEANLKLTPGELRETLAPLVGDPRAREPLEVLASFAAELAAKDGLVIPTRFRFVNGGKHQSFLPALIELRRLIRAEHLRAALFAPWAYSDEKHTFRWDPAEARPHAHRWSDPSSESSATVWGANLLAFEALPLFPCVPAHGANTTGWRGLRFTWPIWEPPIGVDVLRSLLASPAIACDVLERERLRAQGVVEVFSAQRFDDGKGVCNFAGSSPA
jgi:hypothetical protein